MVPKNVLQRTFRIMYGNGTGTAFTIDVDGKQYLVTAHHVIENIKDTDSISIYHEQQWKQIPTRLVGIGSPDFDIAVLALPYQISPTYPLTPTTAKIFLGQDIYFLGYPYGLHIEVGPDLNASFPLPLVKKGIVSSFIFGDNQLNHLLLDGHNNPGFSGGPVFYSTNGNQEFCVAGVISGYRYAWQPVFAQGQEIPLAYQYNTGLINAVGIDIALGLINANPIGFSL